MKLRGIQITFLLLLAIRCGAAVTLEWDASPPGQGVTLYRLYAKHPWPERQLRMVSAPVTTATVDLPEGAYTVYVTASAAGVESLPSNYVTFIIFPNGELQNAMLETSIDLQTWVTFTGTEPPSRRRFFRTVTFNP